MNRLLISLYIFCITIPCSLLAERGLIEVYQPISLLGTDLEGDPLRTGAGLPAVIFSRPTIIGGAFPESTVHALSLPHQIAGAPEDFPKESNLIILVGAKIYVEWGANEHQIIADFSKAKAPKNLGITVLQVMQMSALCLQKTLGEHHSKPIKISWLPPKSTSLVNINLPSEIKRKDQAKGNQPHTPQK